MKNFLIKLGILVVILLPFMDTKSKQVNRCYDRLNGAQIEELILTINHLYKPIK
jgi:hypothetical protein